MFPPELRLVVHLQVDSAVLPTIQTPPASGEGVCQILMDI